MRCESIVRALGILVAIAWLAALVLAPFIAAVVAR
jgi:hypothetical protein